MSLPTYRVRSITGAADSPAAPAARRSACRTFIDPGNNSKLTGDVTANGKSVVKGAKLFDLDGGTLKPITISNGVATLTGTTVNLSDDAAKLLDKTFKITALKSGMKIGIATLLVNAK